MARRSLRGSWAQADTHPELVAWENFGRLDLISDSTVLPNDAVTFATNADFCTKPGAITKQYGTDVLFTITPPIKGSALVTLNGRQCVLIANSTDIYAAFGGRSVIPFSTKTDWEKGTGTDIDFTADGTIKVKAPATAATWESPAFSLTDWPYEASFEYVAAVPDGALLTVEYAGSEDSVVWAAWSALPSTGIPDVLMHYIKYRFVLTGAQADFYVDACTVYSRSEFEAPTSIYSGLSNNPVRFASYQDKVYITTGGRPLVYNGTVIRNAGVDAPTATASIAASATEGLPDGNYKVKFTYINADNVESQPSDASASVAINLRKIDWTIPVGPEGTAKRRAYRTISDGAAYYLVATIDDNTTTTYTDNLSDAAIVTKHAMEDNNNTPPNAINICLYNDTMFYVDTDDQKTLWHSKPGRPEHVPQIDGNEFYLSFPSAINLVHPYSNRLFVSGYNYTKFISGSIFNSDPTVSDIAIHDLGTTGAVYQEAAAVVNTQKGPIGLAILADTKDIYMLTPTTVDNIFSVPPISKPIEPVLHDSVDLQRSSLCSFRDDLYVAFSTDVQVLDRRVLARYNTSTNRWQGIGSFPIVSFFATSWRLYGIMEDGSVCRFLNAEDVLTWGKAWGTYWEHVPTARNGTHVPFVVDTAYKAPKKSSRGRYRYLQLVVSGDSITDALEVTVNVDGKAQTVAIGSKDDWHIAAPYGSTYGYGRQDAVISKLFPLKLPPGRYAGIHLYDLSNNPLTIYAVVLVCEPVYSVKGGI